MGNVGSFSVVILCIWVTGEMESSPAGFGCALDWSPPMLFLLTKANETNKTNKTKDRLVLIPGIGIGPITALF